MGRKKKGGREMGRGIKWEEAQRRKKGEEGGAGRWGGGGLGDKEWGGGTQELRGFDGWVKRG